MPIPANQKSNRYGQQLAGSAIAILHKAREIVDDDRPDTDLRSLFTEAEQSMEGVVALLKAIERGEA